MSQFLNYIMPTPILIGKANNPEMCSEIADLAYALRSDMDEGSLVSDEWDRGKKSSNSEDFTKNGVTSFNSTDNLFSIPGWQNASQFLYDFAKHMIESVNPEVAQKMRIINMWTTIYPTGCFIPEHIHSNSVLSAVFYAKAPKNCGEIVFHDPAWASKTMYSKVKYPTFPATETKYSKVPEDGLMVIFPSWLPHRSYANRSEEDRIIVSFNMDLVD